MLLPNLGGYDTEHFNGLQRPFRNDWLRVWWPASHPVASRISTMRLNTAFMGQKVFEKDEKIKDSRCSNGDLITAQVLGERFLTATWPGREHSVKDLER